jgi:hypothetical protein
MSEEEHIIMENSVNEDVDKGIELSILFRMALTYYCSLEGEAESLLQTSNYIDMYGVYEKETVSFTLNLYYLIYICTTRLTLVFLQHFSHA